MKKLDVCMCILLICLGLFTKRLASSRSPPSPGRYPTLPDDGQGQTDDKHRVIRSSKHGYAASQYSDAGYGYEVGGEGLEREGYETEEGEERRPVNAEGDDAEPCPAPARQHTVFTVDPAEFLPGALKNIHIRSNFKGHVVFEDSETSAALNENARHLLTVRVTSSTSSHDTLADVDVSQTLANVDLINKILVLQIGSRVQTKEGVYEDDDDDINTARRRSFFLWIFVSVCCLVLLVAIVVTVLLMARRSAAGSWAYRRNRCGRPTPPASEICDFDSRPTSSNRETETSENQLVYVSQRKSTFAQPPSSSTSQSQTVYVNQSHQPFNSQSGYNLSKAISEDENNQCSRQSPQHCSRLFAASVSSQHAAEAAMIEHPASSQQTRTSSTATSGSILCISKHLSNNSQFCNKPAPILDANAFTPELDSASLRHAPSRSSSSSFEKIPSRQNDVIFSPVEVVVTSKFMLSELGDVTDGRSMTSRTETNVKDKSGAGGVSGRRGVGERGVGRGGGGGGGLSRRLKTGSVLTVMALALVLCVDALCEDYKEHRVDVVISIPRSLQLENIELFFNRQHRNLVDTSRWSRHNTTSVRIFDIADVPLTSNSPCRTEDICPSQQQFVSSEGSNDLPPLAPLLTPPIIAPSSLHLMGCDWATQNCVCQRHYVLDADGSCSIDDKTELGITSTDSGIHVDASPNVFLENLQDARPLETTYYVTNSKQQTDFFWYRDSGLRVNIGLQNIDVIATYVDVSHPRDDSDFVLGNPAGPIDSKQYRRIQENYCRHPIPDYYTLMLEVIKDRRTQASTKRCEEAGVGVTSGEGTGNGVKSGGRKQSDISYRSYCPERLSSGGSAYIERSINEPCRKSGSFPERLTTAPNSIVCIESDELLREVFHLNPAPVYPVFVPADDMCMRSKSSCDACLNRQTCLSHVDALDRKTCQIDCYLLEECKRAARCREPPLECAQGDAYRYTLEPVYGDMKIHYRCHIRRMRPEILYQLWFYVKVPGSDFETKRIYTTVTQDDIRSSTPDRGSDAEASDVRQDAIEFLTIEYGSETDKNLGSLGNDLILAGYQTTSGSGRLVLNHTVQSIGNERDVRYLAHVGNVHQLSPNLHVTSVEFSEPFAYSTSTWNDSGHDQRLGTDKKTANSCHKNITKFIRSGDAGIVSEPRRSRPVNVVMNKIEQSPDAAFQYLIKSIDSPPHMRIKIPGNMSLLRWWFRDRPPHLAADSLHASISTNLTTLHLNIRGSLTHCPGFVSLIVKCWFTSIEMLRYDTLVSCPLYFNLTVVIPGNRTDCQGTDLKAQGESSRSTTEKDKTLAFEVLLDDAKSIHRLIVIRTPDHLAPVLESQSVVGLFKAGPAGTPELTAEENRHKTSMFSTKRRFLSQPHSSSNLPSSSSPSSSKLTNQETSSHFDVTVPSVVIVVIVIVTLVALPLLVGAIFWTCFMGFRRALTEKAHAKKKSEQQRFASAATCDFAECARMSATSALRCHSDDAPSSDHSDSAIMFSRSKIDGNFHSERRACNSHAFTNGGHHLKSHSPLVSRHFNRMPEHRQMIFVLYVTWKIVYSLTCTFTVFLLLLGACLRERIDSLDDAIVRARIGERVGGSGGETAAVDGRSVGGISGERQDDFYYSNETEQLRVLHLESQRCFEVAYNMSWSKVFQYKEGPLPGWFKNWSKRWSDMFNERVKSEFMQRAKSNAHISVQKIGRVLPVISKYERYLKNNVVNNQWMLYPLSLFNKTLKPNAATSATAATAAADVSRAAILVESQLLPENGLGDIFSGINKTNSQGDDTLKNGKSKVKAISVESETKAHYAFLEFVERDVGGQTRSNAREAIDQWIAHITSQYLRGVQTTLDNVPTIGQQPSDGAPFFCVSHPASSFLSSRTSHGLPLLNRYNSSRFFFNIPSIFNTKNLRKDDDVTSSYDDVISDFSPEEESQQPLWGQSSLSPSQSDYKQDEDEHVENSFSYILEDRLLFETIRLILFILDVLLAIYRCTRVSVAAQSMLRDSDLPVYLVSSSPSHIPLNNSISTSTTSSPMSSFPRSLLPRCKSNGRHLYCANGIHQPNGKQVDFVKAFEQANQCSGFEQLSTLSASELDDVTTTNGAIIVRKLYERPEFCTAAGSTRLRCPVVLDYRERDNDNKESQDHMTQVEQDEESRQLPPHVRRQLSGSKVTQLDVCLRCFACLPGTLRRNGRIWSDHDTFELNSTSRDCHMLVSHVILFCLLVVIISVIHVVASSLVTLMKMSQVGGRGVLTPPPVTGTLSSSVFRVTRMIMRDVTAWHRTLELDEFSRVLATLITISTDNAELLRNYNLNLGTFEQILTAHNITNQSPLTPHHIESRGWSKIDFPCRQNLRDIVTKADTPQTVNFSNDISNINGVSENLINIATTICYVTLASAVLILAIRVIGALVHRYCVLRGKREDNEMIPIRHRLWTSMPLTCPCLPPTLPPAPTASSTVSTVGFVQNPSLISSPKTAMDSVGFSRKEFVSQMDPTTSSLSVFRVSSLHQSLPVPSPACVSVGDSLPGVPNANHSRNHRGNFLPPIHAAMLETRRLQEADITLTDAGLSGSRACRGRDGGGDLGLQPEGVTRCTTPRVHFATSVRGVSEEDNKSSSNIAALDKTVRGVVDINGYAESVV